MEKKIKLKVKSYKVPIKRLSENKVEEVIIPYTDDMIIKVEEIELESIFKLTENAQKVSQYNIRQLKLAESNSDRDYIIKKIIVKQ